MNTARTLPHKPTHTSRYQHTLPQLSTCLSAHLGYLSTPQASWYTSGIDKATQSIGAALATMCLCQRHHTYKSCCSLPPPSALGHHVALCNASQHTKAGCAMKHLLQAQKLQHSIHLRLASTVQHYSHYTHSCLSACIPCMPLLTDSHSPCLRVESQVLQLPP